MQYLTTAGNALRNHIRVPRCRDGVETDRKNAPSTAAVAIRLEQCFSLMQRTSWGPVRPAGGGTDLERPECS